MGDCSYYILYTRNKLAVRVLSLAGGGGTDNPFAFTDRKIATEGGEASLKQG